MKSIRDIYKIGKGPSSSHTMGPAKAMSIYVAEHPNADSYKVILFGSLADTGKGHGTDKAIEMTISPPPTLITRILSVGFPFTTEYISRVFS